MQYINWHAMFAEINKKNFYLLVYTFHEQMKENNTP